MKIAIVHDWLYGGGAEKVVLELHRMFPEAPIYTSYCTNEWRQKLDDKVITGYLQNWPFSSLRKFLPVLRQRWFKNLNLNAYDIVISSSGNGEAKFVRVKPGAKHICYCHSPTHFYWRHYDTYMKNPGFGVLNPLARMGLKLLVKPLRKADYQAAQKVDQFIANSVHIQRDIKTYYGRDSQIIYPPVDTDRFSKITPDDAAGFIIWGRHVPFKRLDIAVEACTQLNIPLTIIGEGPDTPRLKKLAGSTITFTGWIEENSFNEYVSRAHGFIFPGEEDFGIAPVEAMAAGLPVIAYQAGGALDYVNEKTGVFFQDQSVNSLVQALQNFNAMSFNPEEIKKSALCFDSQMFRSKINELVSESAAN